jgi:hypothetical protein
MKRQKRLLIEFFETLLKWGNHASALIRDLQGHKGLRKIEADIQDEDEAFGPDFSFTAWPCC